MNNNHNPKLIADELLKLKELLDDGVVTKEEFDAAKKQLIGSVENVSSTSTQKESPVKVSDDIGKSPVPAPKGCVVVGVVFVLGIASLIIFLSTRSCSTSTYETPSPSTVISTPTPTPTPTPEPTPDPNAITDVDYVDMLLSTPENDLIGKRVRITALVDNNLIEVASDGEFLGYIQLRQPIEFIKTGDDEDETSENDKLSDNESNIDDDEEVEEEPVLLTDSYFTIIGRLSIIPAEGEELLDEVTYLFLDEVIAELATDEEIALIQEREDERFAERIAREEAEEAERLAPKSIALDTEELTLRVGKTHTIKATIDPKDSPAQVFFSIEPSALAEVDENGKITALRRGEGFVKASTSNGVVAQCSLLVEEQSPVTIRDMKYSIDSVGGVEWTMRFRNNTDKDIDYVTLRWDCYNAVGDKIICQISRSSEMAIRFTGPLAAGSTSSTKRNSTKFYNSTYSRSVWKEITVDFSDGTSITLDKYYFDIQS